MPPLTLKICPFCCSCEPVVQFSVYEDDAASVFLQLVCSGPEGGCGASFEKRVGMNIGFGIEQQASEADREELAAKWNRRCSDVVGSRMMTKLSKRISEVREIAGLLEERAPDLYRQCPWVIGWLASTDKYLCDLRNVMRPLGVDARWDEERARFERFMPLPDRLGKHSVYAKWPHDADGTIIPANDHV